MIGTTLISCITGGFSIGLGCGTCCSPAIGVFLSTYIVSHSQNMKKAFITFFSFFFGKILSVISLCMISSYLGNKFLFKDGHIGSIDLSKVMSITFIVLGSFLIVKYFYNRQKSDRSCKSCSGSCGSNLKNKDWSPLIIGIAYGLTPCAPLLLIIGYASTISITNVILLGLCFSMASIISPMIVVVLLAGIISNNLYEELPKYIDLFKLMCYGVLIFIGIKTL